MNEQWRPVVGYEGMYEVSSRGRVRSLPRESERAGAGRKRWPGQVLAARATINGYPVVNLSRDGKRKVHKVHHLVAYAFLGPRPDRMDICHWDGDRTNNALENLRYDTRSANNLDRRRHGTFPGGSECQNRHVVS